jgi:uncharacterized protein with PQ loop repeat
MADTIVEAIGLVGTLINTISVLPQIIKTILTKNVSSLSLMFLLSWFLGCGLLMIYCILTEASLPILLNYLFNTLFPGILLILYLKYK